MTQAKFSIGLGLGLFFKFLSKCTKPNVFVLEEEN